jgi:uncharacterized membrane protein YdjX (TVP38/TMEM64 family)
METPPPIVPTSTKPWKKLLVLVVIVAAAVIGYIQFRDALTLQHLATKEAELRSLQQDHAILVYGVAFLVYVAVTGLSLPGAAALTLICGWLFGFWRGTLLVSFASTTGATVAFLVSRFLLRDSLQRKFGDRLATFNQALEREGAFYLFMLRLIPAVPFFVINVVMGLTRVRTRTYWWVSQLGMLPGTAVYVYAGSSVPNLATLADKGATGILSPQLLVAFVLLGLVPLMLKKVIQRFRPAVAPRESVASHESTINSQPVEAVRGHGNGSTGAINVD